VLVVRAAGDDPQLLATGLNIDTAGDTVELDGIRIYKK